MSHIPANDSGLCQHCPLQCVSDKRKLAYETSHRTEGEEKETDPFHRKGRHCAKRRDCDREIQGHGRETEQDARGNANAAHDIGSDEV
jgi:hypothetical protein